MSECCSTCRVHLLHVLVLSTDFLFNTSLSGGLQAAADLSYKAGKVTAVLLSCGQNSISLYGKKKKKKI